MILEQLISNEAAVEPDLWKKRELNVKEQLSIYQWVHSHSIVSFLSLNSNSVLLLFQMHKSVKFRYLTDEVVSSS